MSIKVPYTVEVSDISQTINFNKEATADDIAMILKNAIIMKFGVSCTTVEPGSSTEIHKEVEDKRIVREMMCLLQRELPLVFSDEVHFNIGSDAKGPHRILDLIVGKGAHWNLDKCVIVMHCDHQVHISGDKLAETKSPQESQVKCWLLEQ